MSAEKLPFSWSNMLSMSTTELDLFPIGNRGELSEPYPKLRPKRQTNWTAHEFERVIDFLDRFEAERRSAFGFILASMASICGGLSVSVLLSPGISALNPLSIPFWLLTLTIIILYFNFIRPGFRYTLTIIPSPTPTSHGIPFEYVGDSVVLDRMVDGQDLQSPIYLDHYWTSYSLALLRDLLKGLTWQIIDIQSIERMALRPESFEKFPTVRFTIDLKSKWKYFDPFIKEALRQEMFDLITKIDQYLTLYDNSALETNIEVWKKKGTQWYQEYTTKDRENVIEQLFLQISEISQGKM